MLCGLTAAFTLIAGIAAGVVLFVNGAVMAAAAVAVSGAISFVILVTLGRIADAAETISTNTARKP